MTLDAVSDAHRADEDAPAAGHSSGSMGRTERHDREQQAADIEAPGNIT